MGVLNFLTGTAGYTAILAAFGLAVAAHFFAPRAWSALAWTVAFGLLGAAFVGQRELTATERAAHADTRAAHAKTLQQIAEKTAAAQAAVNALIQERAAKVAALDAQLTKEKANAVKANEDRRRALAAGNVRMRLAGTSCPVAPDLPATSATARLDDGAGITVSRETGQAVSDLRAALIDNEAQIAGLQRYVREVCMEGAK